MLWFFLSLFVAASSSTTNILTKKASKEISPLTFLLLFFGFIIPFDILLLLLLGGTPNVSEAFYFMMLLSIGLDVIAFICSIKGIQLSDLSLIVPLSSFLPVFTIIFNAILFQEFPTPIKFLGILLIVVGVYVLNLKDVKRGFLRPIQDVLFNRGAQLFLFANFIWSVTPIFQKQAVLATMPQSPAYIALVNSVGIFSVLIVIVFLKREKISKAFVKKHTPLFLLLGVLGASSQYAAFTAFSLTNVAYPNAVFKLSTLFTVIVGGILLKEKNVGSRIIATIIMLTGVVFLIF